MKAIRAFVAVPLLFLAAAAGADDRAWIGLKAGTLGIGVEGAWHPLPWFDLRGGFNAFDYDDDGSEAGIDYDAALALESGYATGNFGFPGSPFRVSVGLFANNNELTLRSTESGTVKISGTAFAADDVGTLRSVTSFRDTAPYLGLGFDAGLYGKLRMSIDLGVLFQSIARVTLDADGPLAGDPRFEEALEEERRQLAGELDSLEIYPVASFGLSLNFL